MVRLFTRAVLPLLVLSSSAASLGQEENEDWGLWYSETLGVLFLSMGKPVEEVVKFNGVLAEKAGHPIAVGFNVGDAEFSIVRLKLKEGENLSPKEVLGLRLSVPRTRAHDFKMKEEKELPDSEFPCAHSWAEYTGPDGDPVSRRSLVVGHGVDIWIFEVAGLTKLEAREAANKFFDSIRMDVEGRVKPGDKRKELWQLTR